MNGGFESRLGMLYLGKQDWVETGFHIEVLTLLQNIKENRLRRSIGPVNFFTDSVTLTITT